ncbi:MAG: 4Fe-4S binding protein [Gammaproteobacteria bacterium]|nr:4Fe-4S binding protein [Gammaproteobacteria bacterium]
MKANESLAKIPVVQAATYKPDGLQWKRAASKYGFILVLLLIPILGIFRIDVSSGFIFMGRQIWFADFFVVFGFWLALACTAILFYSTVGTAFCGWVCPQNTFSGIMDNITTKLLGKRALIDWEGKNSKIANKKNKPLNWFLLVVQTILISMLVAFIPLMYFISPGAIWSFVTFQVNEDIPSSLYWIYSVFVFILAVNFGVVRHYFCRYMCVYRMWQFLFKTTHGLHLEYDESRKADCEKCNYCVTSCMVDIDPRNTNTYDSCTNCGACITACNSVHAKKKEPGLLKLKFGKRSNKEDLAARSIASLPERMGWVLPVWMLGVGLFAWGLFVYEPYHLAVYKSESGQGSQISEYRINIANKIYRQGDVEISIHGIDDKFYALSKNKMSFDSVGRQDSFVTLGSGLSKGLHSFIVKVESKDGWKQQIRMQHFVNNG